MILPLGCVFFSGFLSVVVSNRLLFMFGSFQVFIVCIFYDDITLMGDCHLGNSNYSYDVNCPANLASPGLFLLCYRDMHRFAGGATTCYVVYGGKLHFRFSFVLTFAQVLT